MSDLTTTSYALLGLLSLRPWSAYDLAQQMKRSLHFCWPRAERGVYDEPKKLVAHGLASATTEPRGSRSRTVYTISPAGRRTLRRWLAQPSAPPQLESEALLRAQFFEQGTLGDALATLDSLREYAAAVRDQITDQAREYARTGGPFPRRLHLIAVTGRFVLDYVAMLERWASWAEQELEQWPSFGPLPPAAALERFKAVAGELGLLEQLECVEDSTASP
jgi:PadR family transcriptional regulator AphA